MKKNRRKIIFLFIFVICASVSFAQIAKKKNNNKILKIVHTKSRYTLGMYAGYLRDKDQSYTINQVASQAFVKKFKKNKTKIINLGFDTSAHWFRFRLNYPVKKEQLKEWLLQVAYPSLDYVNVYIKQKDGAFKKEFSGDRLPFKQRKIKHRMFTFRLRLQPGTTTIYLRIQTKGAVQLPLYLYSSDRFIQQSNNDLLPHGIYYGVMLIMLTYNLFIFFAVRDRSYIYFVIFVFFNILYQLSLDGFAMQILWPNWISWGNKCILFFIGTAASAAVLFGISFLNVKKKFPEINKTLVITFFIVLASGVITLVIDYNIGAQVVTIVTNLAAMLLLVIGYIVFIKGYRAARYYLLAWSVFLLGTVTLGLNKFGVVPKIFFTDYAQQIGSLLQVILFSFALGDKINIMNDELNTAYQKISISEEKYKRLVEGSNEIVFSLDKDWKILTANSSIERMLKIKQEKVSEIDFFDLLYEGTGESMVVKKIVREKLDLFAKDKEPISFNVVFKSSISTEPIEMKVRMEYLNIGGGNEILCKAHSIMQDSLVNYFKYEKQGYEIGNYLLTAEELTYRLTRNLYRFIDTKKANTIRIALREILINAIEHGNLNISFEDKTKALKDDNYFYLIADKRKKKSYKGRSVLVEYSLDEKGVTYRITDQGFGFDYKKMLEVDVDTVNKKMLPHGRGIEMAGYVFDEIKYFDKGNKVELIKNFN